LKYNYEISRQLERELDKLRRRNKKQFEIISIKPHEVMLTSYPLLQASPTVYY